MSDKKEDGGPAFPMQMPIDDAGNPTSASVMGMSLRAYFAAKAMQGFVSKMEKPEAYAPVVAAMAYEIAAAMLAELDKREEPRETNDGKA